MSTRNVSPRLFAGSLGIVGVAGGLLGAAPAGAAPDADARGYVDSSARCPSPALMFGETTASRVAICETSNGYEYRGVRLRDGATLTVSAAKTSAGYSAENAGIEYEVTPKALIISSGNEVIREEKMVDFHPGGAQASTPSIEAPKSSGPPLAAEVGGSGDPSAE